MKDHSNSVRLVVLLAIAATAGCGDAARSGPVERSAGQQVSALTFESVGSLRLSRLFAALTGEGLNGRSLNGQVLDGLWIESVSLDAVQLPSGQVKPLELRGTVLYTHTVAGGRGGAAQALNERHLVGAVFAATLDDGSTVQLRVDAVSRSEERRDRDVLRYGLSYQLEDGWAPLCGLDEEGAPVLAIPLAGVWDYREGVPGGGGHTDAERELTFGCEGHVLAKCVQMGYKPWVSGMICDETAPDRPCEPASLAPLHQACTRLLRADYCGDGTSYTADGTLVNAYDGLGIRYDSEDWLFEAEWDADGARCAVTERLSPPLVPPCWGELQTSDCGALEHFENGTLLMSEDEPRDPGTA
jgi:hypothetical protein